MIYLDIVTIYTPEEGIKCAGGLRIFESRQVAKRYMRIKDDRAPGEEMLIPLESLDETWNEMNSESEIPQIKGQALLNPF